MKIVAGLCVINDVDDDGYTALMRAVLGASGKLLRFPLDSGANVDAVNAHDVTALMLAVGLDNDYLLNQPTGGINIADVVRMLLESGVDVNTNDANADVNAVDRSGYTALMVSVCGSERNAFDRRFDNLNRRPHVIIDMVRLLVDNGASVTAVDNGGYTVLMHAADRGHTEIVTYLLDHVRRLL